MRQQIKRAVVLGLFALAVGLGAVAGVNQHSSAPAHLAADPGGTGSGTGG